MLPSGLLTSYLRFIHPGRVHPSLSVTFPKDVSRVQGQAAAGVVQCGVAHFLCIPLADSGQACPSDANGRRLHVEEEAAVFKVP